jgi:hypothetical protein
MRRRHDCPSSSWSTSSRRVGPTASSSGIPSSSPASCTHARPFAQEGVRLPDRHAVARFARICGPEQPHEIIVFVHEYVEGTTLDGILDRASTAFRLEPLAAARP